MTKNKQIAIILFIISLFSLFCYKQNYFYYNIIALLSCLFALYLTQFSFFSFNAILILGHLVQYPLASFLVDSLETKSDSILESEFSLTVGGMICLTIAMMGLSIGIMGYKSFFKKNKIFDNKHYFKKTRVSLYLILSLLSCFVLYIIIAIKTNTYYHSVAGDYDNKFANSYGIIGYLLYFGYVGLGLQCYNYFIFKRKRDGIVLLIYISIIILLMLPSGSRRFILLPIVLVFVLYINTIKFSIPKLLWVSFIIIILTISLPLLEYLRNEVNSHGSIFDRMTDAFSLPKFLKDTENTKTLALLGRRLSDYTSVGYIYEYLQYPNGQLIGFTDLLMSPVFLVPTLIRPETMLSFNYDAIIMEGIGFRPEIGGSSPTMLIGDFLIRGGLVAVFFGFIFLGFILEYMSNKLNPFKSIKGMVIWIMMFDTITSLHTMTILKLFVLFTKQFFLFLIFAELINYINKRLKKDDKSNEHYLSSDSV